MFIASSTWGMGSLALLFAKTWIFDSSPLEVTYKSWKSSSSVWFAQLGSLFWASIQAVYSTEEALDSTDNSLDKFMLVTVDLPLRAPIWISSETQLEFARLDTAEEVIKGFIFTISLLGATIQDSGMKERSDVIMYDVTLFPNPKSKNK